MYALASLGLRRSAVAFAWQAWDLVAVQGAALSLLLRGRRGTWWHCRGSDVRFGVAGAPRGRREACTFCVAGVGLGGTAGGLMYALASLGLRRAAVAFAWQAWDLVALQGV